MYPSRVLSLELLLYVTSGPQTVGYMEAISSPALTHMFPPLFVPSSGAPKRHSLSMHLTERTYSPLLFVSSTARPKVQCPFGNNSSIAKTMSSTIRLRVMVCHYGLNCNMGKYPVVHLLQNRSARYCTCFHLRFE